MATIHTRSLWLRRSQINFLFGYYGILSIVSTLAAATVFIPGPMSGFDFMTLAIVGSGSMACAGSGIYYLRKLYKILLQETLVVTADKEDMRPLATFAYFIARPMFSIIFALVVVIGIRSGLALSSSKPTAIDYGFVQLCMFFSFFCGFLSGRFLRKLETWGESMIDRLSKESKRE
jgi:hypothetical protein